MGRWQAPEASQLPHADMPHNPVPVELLVFGKGPDRTVAWENHLLYWAGLCIGSFHSPSPSPTCEIMCALLHIQESEEVVCLPLLLLKKLGCTEL